jgi:hypothetical protein
MDLLTKMYEDKILKEDVNPLDSELDEVYKKIDAALRYTNISIDKKKSFCSSVIAYVNLKRLQIK